MCVWSAESGERCVLRRQAVVGRSLGNLPTPRRLAEASRRETYGSSIRSGGRVELRQRCFQSMSVHTELVQLPSLSAAARSEQDDAAESCGCADDDEKAGDRCPG
jgi:hypothetical protein